MDYINQIRPVIKDTQEEYQDNIFVDDALMWENDKAKYKKTVCKILNYKESKNIGTWRGTRKRNQQPSNMKEKGKKDTLDALDTKKTGTGENNWIPNERFNFEGKMQVA